ncbi:MAG: hypothetical protein GY936_08675 [Ignavibacteriae bacterium]|nr:hypothetical protein [Ignavibacteriota bacterium]
MDEPVLIQIKKGLSISKLGGDLNFGKYVLSTSNETINKTNEEGINFEVTGHPGRAVTINFADVTLNNNAWVTANSGTAGNLTFLPEVESTGGSNTYLEASSVTTGGSVNLVNDVGIGKLYLWVGGNIDVTSATNQGDYVGTFTLSVAY